tara:strand:- start:22 stop:744 length:723 start_codon:yes stop_codon:yes gene_type:complete
MKNTLIPIFLIVIFLLGGELAKRNIFPYGKGLRSMLPEILHLSKKEIKFCPKKDAVIYKFKFFSNKKIDNIFIGDSVVDGALSEGLFNLNYTLIAQSGATIDCTTLIVDYIKKIEPKNVVVYLGGNDADGQSNYGSDIGINHYTKFLSELNKIKSISKIYLIGINYAGPRRNSEYVKNLNDYFKRAEDGKKIFYIESFEKLNFREKPFLELTYDGEHLKYLGYKEWFTYLSEKIDNFILE